jgi:uncharacterized damage-inducible protein DinB
MESEPYFPTIRQLAEYEVWCNQQSIRAAAALTQEQLFRQFPFGFGTIHRTLFHTLGVLGYWTGFILPVVVDQWRWDYDSGITIDQLRTLNDQLCADFIGAIDASHAAGLLDHDRRLVQVFHLVTHGTHHRTQFITMLRMLEIDPPFEAGDFAGWHRVQKLKA